MIQIFAIAAGICLLMVITWVIVILFNTRRVFPTMNEDLKKDQQEFEAEALKEKYRVKEPFELMEDFGRY